MAAEVAVGRYRSSSEVIRAGLRSLQQGTPGSMVSAAVEPAPDEVATTLTPLDMHYRALLASAVEYAILGFNQDGSINQWNAGAVAITDWSEGDMLGRDGAVIFTPEDQIEGVPAQEMRTALAQGSAVNERWHMRRDGSRYWGSRMLMSVRDADGQAAGFLKIMTDRTEAHRVGRSLEVSEARLRAVFNAAPVGAGRPSGRAGH